MIASCTSAQRRRLRRQYAGDVEIVDAGGQYVMPGNICAHTHFYGAFARGMAIPGDAPKDFPEILARLWWKLDKALTLERCEVFGAGVFD